MAIGATHNDGGGTYSGHVRIYENNNGTWTQIGSDIDGEYSYNYSGWSVSLSSDGSVVAIGAPYNDDGGYDSGHVRIYENDNGTWTQIASDIDGESSSDYSGYSVQFCSQSSDGTVVAIGAHQNDGGGSNSGHVRIYKNIGTTGLNFTTDDTTAPVLSSSTPADDATAITEGSNIVLNFSEVVDVESGNIVIYKSSDDSVVETIDVYW